MMTRDEAMSFRPLIRISQMCINKAVRNSFRLCMVVLGIFETIREARLVTVKDGLIKFHYDGWTFTYRIPFDEEKKIKLFDDKGKEYVRPHQIQLTEQVKAIPFQNRGPGAPQTPKRKTRNKPATKKKEKIEYRLSGNSVKEN